ncbi:MAG: CapA family protein, partial [Muribaculaceae bacterium]|nr:CapA family protein [Muribaculaceae bacterium]
RNAAERAKNYPFVADVKGMKIAFLNYTYGTNGITVQGDVVVDYIDRAKIHTDIQAARRKGADLVVACMHWGVEYQLVQNKEQELLADWLVDEGVDLVIGGHPHVIQPMQMRRAKDGRQVLVVYSMGNFISGMRKPDTRGGAMVRVKVGWQNGKPVVKSAGYKLVFVQDPDKSVPNYSLVPADREWLVRADQRSFFDAFCSSARKIFNRYNNGVLEDSWNWSPNLLIPFLVDSDAVEK